jgi:hypothetical protein
LPSHGLVDLLALGLQACQLVAVLALGFGALT